MTRRLVHRGPDDLGIWRSPAAQLGHTRLSILDLSPAGHQPVVLGPLTLVYNGEIYNFRELRDGLEGPFHSDCDAEVLLHLYARDGADCLHAIEGMFAFAVWDDRHDTLFAARDRLGIKPLLYRELPGGGIAFASELKALIELGRPQIDRTALSDYFTYKWVPAPKTIYAGISQLPPAHQLVWRRGSPARVSRYWSPSLKEQITDAGEASERLDALLSKIVPEYTMADVPVGVFLSGGIDSSTVVAYLDRPRTFTLGSTVKRRDESELAREVAEHFKTEHHEELGTTIDFEEALETLPAVFYEPFGDSGAWAVYLVAQVARRHVKVALCGEGGDELFSGYGKYSKWLTDGAPRFTRTLSEWMPPFGRGARSLQRRTSQGLERYAAYLSPFTPQQKRALLHPDLLPPDYDDLWHLRPYWRSDLEPLRRMQWVDLHTVLSGHLMTKVDRATMAHSLEARPPLCDHRLVEFGLSVDTRLLRDVEQNRGKLIVRSLMGPRMPPNHFDRKKRCFNLPIAGWVRRNPDKVRVAMERLETAGVIRPQSRPRYSSEQYWMLLNLERWMALAGHL
jgi:asparagine synthase (glutamine-hydrolysing)